MRSFCLTDNMQDCPRILTGGNKANNWTTALDLRRVNFNVFNILLGRIPWEAALGRRWMQKS